MLEKDTHDHVDDTSSETDNLTRLKQLLDEWKMYYLERDEKENGHVFELPLRTENEHHFRLRILLGKDQNICTIRIFFSFMSARKTAISWPAGWPRSILISMGHQSCKIPASFSLIRETESFLLATPKFCGMM